MNQELEELLKRDYQYAIDGQQADAAEAATARDEGDMATYFDLSLYLQLADLCWALEKWDDAKHWYQHNARILSERRAWRAEHMGPEGQTEGILDWEATTLIKGGDLQSGRETLQRAIANIRNETDIELKLAELGLHAAQAGLPELANEALKVIDARKQLPAGGGTDATQARDLLHYEPAQIRLLLGDWDQFKTEIQKLRKPVELIHGRQGFAFPEPLQAALLAATNGLSAITAMKSGGLELEAGRKTARELFEEAMLHFYKFNSQIDWNLYFMRLNTRFADEVASRQPINPNPFATAG